MYSKILFFLNNVDYKTGFISNGVPIIDINKGSKLIIGKNLKINNGLRYNRIGRQQPCFFIANYGGEIVIGDDVGMSSTAIVCHKRVRIGSNVKIGGGTVIYDTDFHNLDVCRRTSIKEDITTVKKKEVEIKDNVFIGAHCIILKGVTIGENSIIGAGSVLTKSVPHNQIWAGNPAQFVKFIEFGEKSGMIEKY
ncbi:acyltransferase [Fibrisoma montanum]|uniref:acyltransferase n=1 Tax=Fibrisoma montanum TaxID=2305895 RepID=UPI001E466648|nr:acyltransferase [Fibrisoma montanum]